MSILPPVQPTTSGTTAFNLSAADIILECFDRIQIRPPGVGQEQLLSAKTSANLILQDYANRGINLWRISLLSIPLIQGVASYNLPANIIGMYDTYIRTYQLGAATTVNTAVSTVMNSTTVSINWPNHGLSVGNYLQVIIPLSVGGLLLYGFYQVVSVPDANDLTITSPVQAISTVTAGGAVPVFTTAMNSNSILVTLNNHGLLAGDPFNVQVSTTCGGAVIYGSYTVASVVGPNQFTFAFPNPAPQSATAAENGGQAQYAGQVQNTQPSDIILYPLSRTDYAMTPNKFAQGRPTAYWFDRTLPQSVTMWQVPDNTQPYQLMTYVMSQIEDASPTGNQILDLPTRFLEAFCAELTAKLAEKWKPELWQMKIVAAEKAWQWASDEDREKVSTYIQPCFDQYFF